jgi:hypothetical protein
MGARGDDTPLPEATTPSFVRNRTGIRLDKRFTGPLR